MKKIIVGALFLLVGAGIGVPFVNGLMMEKSVKQSFANLNTLYSETGSGVSIEILQYDRNIFSTEIEWKIKFGSLQAIYGVEEIILVDQADHGFTGIVSKTSLEKNKWFTDFVNHKLDGRNPLTITTEFKLSGQTQSLITLHAFSLPLEGKVVEIEPGRLSLEFDKDLKSFYSAASWEGFSVPDRLEVEGISINSSLERVSTSLWDSALSFGLKKSKTAGNFEQFDLVNFKGDYSFDVDQEENTVSVVATFGADHLLAGMEQVDNSFVRIGLINMDAGGFEEFMALYTRVANTVLKDMRALEDAPGELKAVLQKQMDQTRFQMITAGERLLKKGLELQISDLQAQLPSGEVKGDVVLRLNKDMTFAQFVPLFQQPKLALDIFFLQSDITFPAELVGDDSTLLSPIYPGMSTGLLVRVGENLVSRIATKDGKLYVNGLEVELK